MSATHRAQKTNALLSELQNTQKVCKNKTKRSSLSSALLFGALFHSQKTMATRISQSIFATRGQCSQYAYDCGATGHWRGEEWERCAQRRTSATRLTKILLQPVERTFCVLHHCNKDAFFLRVSQPISLRFDHRNQSQCVLLVEVWLVNCRTITHGMSMYLFVERMGSELSRGSALCSITLIIWLTEDDAFYIFRSSIRNQFSQPNKTAQKW